MKVERGNIGKFHINGREENETISINGMLTCCRVGAFVSNQIMFNFRNGKRENQGKWWHVSVLVKQLLIHLNFKRMCLSHDKFNESIPRPRYIKREILNAPYELIATPIEIPIIPLDYGDASPDALQLNTFLNQAPRQFKKKIRK